MLKQSLLAFLFVAACVANQPAQARVPVMSTAGDNIRFPKSFMYGVNLAGCEFMNNGALCPSVADMKWYADQGFTTFRIPFNGFQASNPAIVAKLKAVADAATARGLYVILDRHDYGNSFAPDQVPFWVDLLKNFPDHERVMVDTMNEPRKGKSYEPDPVTGESYATDVNKGIAAFRAAGLRHKLLIEWKGWSGMQRFNKNETGKKPCETPACSFDKAGGPVDPLKLTMVSGHRYFDQTGSGTNAGCRGDTPGIALTTNGAGERNMKVWVGEMAFGNYNYVNGACVRIGTLAISIMTSRPQTYLGVTWWGGGRGWNENYLFKIEPKKGTRDTAPQSLYTKMLLGQTLPKTEGLIINFNQLGLRELVEQKGKGVSAASADGNSLTLTNNTWQAGGLAYNITPKTVIEYDMTSTGAVPELAGLGLTAETVWSNKSSPTRMFQVIGTQGKTKAIMDYLDNKQTTKHVRIEVGKYYTGKTANIVLFRDDDSNRKNGTVTVSNLKIIETP